LSLTVTLQASGKRFDVAPGETVLEAARRAGLALPYSCLAGVCGSCKATLVAGECTYPRNPPSALSADERLHHKVLLCQAVPTGDLVVAAREVASVADIPRRRFDVVVAEKAKLGEDIVRLVLRTAPGERMRRLAGQYLDVLLDDGRRRSFSIANAPSGIARHEDDAIELHVRRVAGGGFTAAVFDTLEVGARLRVEGPLGTFVPREDSERPILLMAGGSGFAPIKALVEHFVELGARRPMTLYWGAREPRDLYLRDLPERWARDVPHFRFVPMLSSEVSQGEGADDGARRGLVHEVLLRDHPDLSAFDLYMSGPPAMIDAGRHAFVDAGLPEERLFYDSFEYAPEVIAQILRGRAGLAHD